MRMQRAMILALTLALVTGIGCFRRGRSAVRSNPSPTAGKTVYGPNLSRTKGMKNRHFSARITYSGTWIQTPDYDVRGTLPPGLRFSKATGEISGTPSQSGFWSVKVLIRDKNKSWPEAGYERNYWSKTYEIGIYDQLTDDK